MASSLIQLVLYICAENKDVQENEEQKAFQNHSTRKSQRTFSERYGSGTLDIELEM